MANGKQVLIPLPVVVTPEMVRKKKLYTAWTPVFDIASQGKTEEEAVKNLKEAVGLYSKDKDALKIKSVEFMRFQVRSEPMKINSGVIDDKVACSFG